MKNEDIELIVHNLLIYQKFVMYILNLVIYTPFCINFIDITYYKSFRSKPHF